MAYPLLTRLGEVLVHQYERYLPTAFDESLSLLQKVNKVIEYLNVTGKTVNEAIDLIESAIETQDLDIKNLQEEYELFKNEFGGNLELKVETVLDEWFLSGKLAEIINTDVFDMKADKTDLIETNNMVEILKTGVTNVLDFGAISDFDYDTGIGTDNTLAINNAIDYAEANNTEVRIPKGSYKIDNSIIMKRNTTIKADGAILYYTGAGIAVKAEGSTLGHIYPYIEGLTIDKVNRDKIGVGLSVQFSRMGGQFINCSFLGFEHGVIHSDESVEEKWAWLTSFVGCKFRYNKYGATFLDQSNGVSFDRCLVNNNSDYGLKVKRGYMVNITNSEFELNGQITTGHGVIVEGSFSFNIDGCYFEANGFNDTDSATLHIGGLSSSVMPKITNNFFNGQQNHTIIKVVQSLDVYITGNEFYDTSPPSMYDIDISGIGATNNTFIMGNRASKSTGMLNVGVLNNNAWVQHSGQFYKNTFVLEGDNSKIIMKDKINTSEMKIDIANNKLRFFEETGINFVVFNGDTKQVSLAVTTGATSARPTTPIGGQLYQDTTLNKLITYYSATGQWKDVMGTVV